MAAAVQPQVLPGDLHPLEILGSGQHPFDQLAVLVLDSRPLDESGARLGNAIGEAVANHLQLTQVQHPGGGRNRVDPVRNLGVAESLAEEPTELGLQPGNLAAQLESCLALVDRDAKSRKRLIEKTRHLRKCNHAASKVEAAIQSASSTAIWGTPLT